MSHPVCIVVRLKTHGQKIELAVHRGRMMTYMENGRDVPPTASELRSLPYDPTLFTNAYRKQRATRQSIFTAFGDAAAADVGDSEAVFAYARKTIIQFGEIVEDDMARHKKKSSESEAASKLQSMISDRVISVFTGEAVDQDELEKMLAAAKETQDLPPNVYRPAEGSNLVAWAAYAAYALCQVNKSSIRRRTMQGEVAIKADAKPAAQLLQKVCRDSSELVLLKSKREYKVEKATKKKSEGEEEEEEHAVDEEEEEETQPQAPTFIYTILYDVALLEMAGIRSTRDSAATAVARAAGDLKQSKTAGGTGKGGVFLELFNCAICTDPEDVRLFTQNIVLEPSSGDGAATQAEIDMQNRLKAFEELKSSEAASSNSSVKGGKGRQHDEGGDPYGGGSGGKRGGAKKKRGGDDDEPSSGGGSGGGLEETYARLNLKQLQDMCSKLNLSKGGKKGDMIDRLVAHAEATGTAPSSSGGGKKRR